MADANPNNVAGSQQNTDVEQQTNNNQQDDNKPDVTIESLMAEIAQLKADSAKNKTALDKALKEKGEITKALRAKQTAEEQEAEAKKEAEEQQKAYITELEKFKKTAEAKARYALQGMSEELAVKAAEAEITGDMDTLATIQTQFRLQTVKAAEAEWIKSIPPAQAGTGDTKDKEDPFLAGFHSVTNKF